MRLTPRLRSMAVRQTFVTVAIVLAALLAFAAAAIAEVGAELRAGLSRTIRTDVAGLADIAASGGQGELARRLGDRIALVPLGPDRPRYRLADAAGTRLAGDLPPIGTLDPARSEAGAVTVNGERLLAQATRLKGDATLVVARSLGPIDALLARLWRLLLAAAAATLIVALAVALAFAGRLSRRVGRLNAVFDRFDQGEHGARAGAPGDRDEIAALTRHVDSHLATIEALLRTQRQISDDIAHELRTPLVHLDSRLMRAIEGNRDAGVAEQLEAARADIRSVVSLFDALLDIALAQSGSAGPAAAWINLSDVVGDVAELYTPSAEEAGIGFSTRIADGVELRGEAMQMARLVSNLLDNALKYVPAGGKVRLALTAGPRLIVEDDGPGVPDVDRERIFERFLRSTATGNGHGLGLALVRVIAARHGLGARVEDAAPGARFVIEPVEPR